jgi:membrane protease subunit HflC
MKNTFAGILVFFLFVAGSDAVFVVRETERAILLRFGEIVDADLAPGLHFKMPWVNTVRKFDGRVLTVTAEAQRYLTLEQKALVVDSFAKWRIVDVEAFYTSSTGEESRTSNLLAI